MQEKSRVFYKRLGSRYIHEEIKLQEDMDGTHCILCKTVLNLIRRLAYKCNIFNDAQFEAHFKSAYVTLWYSQFQ